MIPFSWRGVAKDLRRAFGPDRKYYPRKLEVSCTCRSWDIGMQCIGGSFHSIMIDHSRGRL